MNRPFTRFQTQQPQYRINGRIRAREVRVIGVDGQQLGVLELGVAIKHAIQAGVDLVEIAPTAVPPVCRLVDFGKFKYEQAKKDRDSKKHQHSNEVKEIQLSARIDPHDLGIKLEHAIDFLCEDMKVKVSLRFRGREMAHTEFGFKVIRKFLTDVAPWGHPDNDPRLTGRNINVMISPQPKHKRAKNPKAISAPAAPATEGGHASAGAAAPASASPSKAASTPREAPAKRVPTSAADQPADLNKPFSGLELPQAPPA